MSRLTIDMTGEQHQRIKALAAMQGKSMKEYVMERLFPVSDTEVQAWRELQALLHTRIAEAEESGVSGKTVKQVTEDALRAMDTR